MEIMYYIDMPVVIVAMYELLNLAKVKSAVRQIEFYVDRQFIKKYPKEREISLSIIQLKG